MAVNAKGVFLGCKYAIRQMLRQEPLPWSNGDRGWIINTASVQGVVRYFGTSIACTAFFVAQSIDLGFNFNLRILRPTYFGQLMLIYSYNQLPIVRHANTADRP